MANEDKYLPPIHPGEILWEDFMKPLNPFAKQTCERAWRTAASDQ